MKRFVFILFVLSLFSCKETKKENISHLVKEWNNKKIVYPDIMHFTVLGADTNFLFKSEYRKSSLVSWILLETYLFYSFYIPKTGRNLIIS